MDVVSPDRELAKFYSYPLFSKTMVPLTLLCHDRKCKTVASFFSLMKNAYIYIYIYIIICVKDWSLLLTRTSVHNS